jgi:hypothetical protein
MRIYNTFRPTTSEEKKIQTGSKVGAEAASKIFALSWRRKKLKISKETGFGWIRTIYKLVRYGPGKQLCYLSLDISQSRSKKCTGT